VYEVSLSVAACLRSGTAAHVAWIVDDEGLPSRNKGEALVVTPGGGRMGRLLSGALDDQIVALIGEGVTGRLIEVTIDEIGALLTGLPAGGRARCLIAAADQFPPDLWELLQAGRPGALVTHLEGDRITGIELYPEQRAGEAGADAAALFARGVTDSVVSPTRVLTVLWPVPRLVMVGGGPICEALQVAAGPLGWQVQRFGTAAEAAPLIMGFGVLDLVIVSSHDLEVAGAALQAALSSRTGYVAALGTPAVNAARLDWLRLRQVSGTERVYSPAGLDIGAKRPAEVAIAILAEALAVRTGSTARHLRDVAGSRA
jgi:xanthine dehydrogenase accessory factor